MELIYGKCPICGKKELLIHSNNPLVSDIGVNCVAEKINLKNLEDADYFCRTMDIPFDPNNWVKAINKNPNKIIETYHQYFIALKPNDDYVTTTKSLWKELNKEWEKSMTHAELIEAIKPIKDEFVKRERAIWGQNFTFSELIKMENQYQTTVSAFDVNNPMQLDAIRKACITSIMIDKAMLGGPEEVKSLKDLSSAYAQFMKMAKIDELIESSQTDVIRTVADLVSYLEEKGFEFNFYDNTERDIIDKTINNLKEYTRTLVLDSTGLDATLEMIATNYYSEKEEKATVEAINETPLESLEEIVDENFGSKIDDELSEQSIEEDNDDDYEAIEYDEDNF